MGERRDKVLIVTDSLENGGAERQLSLLAKLLPECWQGRVWSLESGPFEAIIRASDVPVTVRQRRRHYDVRPAQQLWRTILAWRPDVVHAWGWMTSVWAGLICRPMGIPLIDCTIRRGLVPHHRGAGSRLRMRLASRVVANSRAGLDAWGIGSGKGRVVYNGFDPDRLQLCSRPATRSGGRFTAVMVARMVGWKDYGAFFDAASRISSSHGKWNFVAVGAGPERERLMSATEELRLRGMVSFPDAGTEVLGVVREANVGILLAHADDHAEGCSNAIMEYMACGLPVICTDSGGNRELVVDGKTGFLIPARDVGTLVDRLLFLKDHPQQALEMGRSGRDRLLKQFSADAMVNNMLAVYREVLPKRASACEPVAVHSK